MKRSIVVIAAAGLFAACGGETAPNTGVLVQAAAGPTIGGADIQYFGMLLFVDGEIPAPANCPTVTNFQAAPTAPYAVSGVQNSGNPVAYSHAAVVDVNDGALWDNRQISDNAVFPMLAVGSDVFLCTYPLDGTFNVPTECTPGSDRGTTVRGVLELTGESHCTTEQSGAVVGGAVGNNSPTLTVLNASLTACANDADFATVEIQIDDVDGDAVDLTVTANPAVAGVTISPSGTVTVAAGGSQIVGVRGPNPTDVTLELALVDQHGLAGQGPFTSTLHLVACP